MLIEHSLSHIRTILGKAAYFSILKVKCEKMNIGEMSKKKNHHVIIANFKKAISNLSCKLHISGGVML
jgi:hypothetical protein